jgi:predicted GNAT superfamily acetyltransferase
MNMNQVVEDLTLLLIYLTSWTEKISFEVRAQRAWKGYDFDTLDALVEKGYIYGSKRAKSVYLTEEGIERARNLERRILPKFEE